MFNTLDGALTFTAAAEYGRLSFMAAVNHASNSASTSQSSWREINNPLRNQLGLPSVLRQREIRIDNDVDVDINTNQTVVDLALRYRAGASWGNTWVQPLIGVFGTYAISEDWQAFAYLDAGGFRLIGERELSGTAQAGIAYALGNSAQASLSYREVNHSVQSFA